MFCIGAACWIQYEFLVGHGYMRSMRRRKGYAVEDLRERATDRCHLSGMWIDGQCDTHPDVAEVERACYGRRHSRQAERRATIRAGEEDLPRHVVGFSPGLTVTVVVAIWLACGQGYSESVEACGSGRFFGLRGIRKQPSYRYGGRAASRSSVLRVRRTQSGLTVTAGLIALPL